MNNFALQYDIKVSASPIIKWAGGKRQLLSELKSRLPLQYNRYFEPFIGGGALFFNLAPENAYISDINAELINLYKVVRDNVSELVLDLSSHENTQEYFTTIRALDREHDYALTSAVKRASRFMYLNKTCFNGLYRVNGKGFFNVPFGRYSNPKVLDENVLYAASEVLQNAEIVNASFNNILTKVQSSDFVYFDPPYIPLSQTSSFTSYTKEDFGMDKQIELRSLCDKLTEKGVKFMLSNSDTDASNKLYHGYNIEKVYASRFINANSSGRGKISEIVIRNYE